MTEDAPGREDFNSSLSKFADGRGYAEIYLRIACIVVSVLAHDCEKLGSLSISKHVSTANTLISSSFGA